MTRHKWDARSKKWIAWGCMITGWIIGLYSFSVIVRYFFSGHVHPLIFGEDAMSFSTACSLVFISIALFWIGFLFREEAIIREYQAGRLTAAQTVQIILALLSSVTVILTTLMAMLRHK